METVPYWLSAAAARQDYLWFLVAAGWMLLLCLARGPDRWLFRSIGVSLVALSAGEVAGMLLVEDASGIPARTFESALRVLSAAPAVGLCGAAICRRVSQPGIISSIGLVLGVALILWTNRSGWPPLTVSAITAGGAGAMCMIALLALESRPGPGNQHSRWRWIVVALLVSPCLASTGPIAEILGVPRRWLNASPLGLLSALCHLGILAGSTRLWLRQEMQNLRRTALPHRLVTPMIIALWLTLGGVLVELSGALAEREFIKHARFGAKACLASFDRETLVECLRHLRLEDIRQDPNPAWQPWIATAVSKLEPEWLPHQERLQRLWLDNPGAANMAITTIAEGWLAHVLFPYPDPTVTITSRVALDRRSVPEDAQLLATGAPLVEGPRWSPYGTILLLGEPIIADNGSAAGWLTFLIDSQNLLVARAPARLLTSLTIVMAGLIAAASIVIRARRRAEVEAEERADAAVAADKMKTDLLARVSHELRTPLQALLGYAELVGQGRLQPNQRRWLESQRAQAGLMQRLVNDLIDLCAIENRIFRLDPKPSRIRNILEEAAQSIRQLADEKGLDFSSEIDPSLPEWMEFDGQRMSQVILNLVGNAVKFTRGGWVKLGAQLTAIDENRAHIEVCVADSGCGIPADQQSAIFEAFTRLESRHQNHEGLGLGLALVRGLCEAMGGSVTVESDGSTGSTFAIRLGLPLAKPTPTPVVVAGSKDHLGQMIAVAEDNALLRELYVAYFRSAGAKVCSANDGEAALQLVMARPRLDALVIDLSMPKITGDQVAKRLRANGFRDLRIVGVSAHASVVDCRRALDAGIDVFLVKPASLGDLSAAVGCRERVEKAEPTNLPDKLIQELQDIFVQETPPILLELEAALRRRDVERIVERAHYLKSSAWVLKDGELLALCTRLHEASIAADLAEAPAMLLELRRLVAARTVTIAAAGS